MSKALAGDVQAVRPVLSVAGLENRAAGQHTQVNVATQINLSPQERQRLQEEFPELEDED